MPIYILFEKVTMLLEWLNNIDYMQLNQSTPVSVAYATFVSFSLDQGNLSIRHFTCT